MTVLWCRQGRVRPPYFDAKFLTFIIVVFFTSSSTNAVEFAPLPDLGTFDSTGNYSDGGLNLLIDGANGFIDVVQPNPLPYDVICDAIAGNLSDRYDSEDLKEPILDAAEYMLGFVICFLIGLLYILILPIVCLCFCCCRCCQKCGGKRVQKAPASTCKRVYFSVALLTITIIMGLGMACTSLSNDLITRNAEESYNSYENIKSDLVTFLDGVVGQFEHIVIDSFDVAVKEITIILDERGVRLAGPVQDYLNKTVDPVLASFDSLSQQMDLTRELLSDVNATLVELKDNSTILEQALENVATSLNSTVAGCILDPCTKILESLEKLTLGMDLESIPSLEDELENIKNVTDQDFSEQKDKARENFDSIPEKINNETQDFVDEVLVALNDFQNQTEDGFHELDDFVQDFEEEINGLDDDDIWEKIKQIDDYRYYTCIGLACLTLLIVIFNIVGMAMGTCGTKKSAHPMERTRLSNAGGNTLVAGAAFSFFFSWLLVLLVMIMFFALGNIAQLCEPLNTLELFEETIDQPGLITDGYWLGDTLYPDENSNLTVSGLLEDCGRDEPLYDALQLVHFFNVSELTEYKEELGIEEKLDSIDINLEDIDIFTTDMEKALRDFQDALNDTSFTDFTDELSNNVTNVDLTEYADTIDNLAANISDDATRWALTNDSQELRRIDKELVEPMEDAADHLVVQLTALEKINDEIQSSIDVIIVEAQAAEDQINSNDTEEILVNTTHLYAEELLLVTDDYVNYAVTQITEEVARCLPVRTIYDSAVVILCNYSIDALNLIWFTLGWCVFFYVPSIIYGVKLAKYYRIMHKEYPKNKKEKKKAKKNQTDSVAMKDMNSDADTADGLDTNHLVVHDQPNHYNGASNKDYSGHANPQYMHDDPIMAYNHPMSARAVPPPPYNDGHQGRGIPAAYQHRVLPYTSNDYSDRSRPYINHQPSAFQRYSQQTDEQNDLNAPDHHHHLSGYYDSLEDSESYNYLKPAKATRNPLYYEHPASGMDIPASAGQIDIDNWTYGNQQMNGGRPMSTGAGFPRNINHLY